MPRSKAPREPITVLGIAPVPHAERPDETTVETARTVAEAERFRDFHERHGWHPESQPHLLFAAFEAPSAAAIPYLVQISGGGVPTTLLVGQVVDVVMPWRIGYQVVHESAFRQVEVLQGGVLGDDSEPRAQMLFDEVCRFLRGGGATAALLRHVRADSAMHRVFQKQPRWSCRDRRIPTSIHWRLRLPESFAAFVKGLSKKSREDCRRFGNRIAKDFGREVAVVPMHRSDHGEKARSIVESIACRTYQRALGAGFRDTGETRARWQAAADRGWLRAYVLYLGGEPAAFCTGFQIAETLWLEHVGFDPAFRRYQPGGHLLQRVIEQVSAEGRVRVIDFGVGDADYKRRICNEHHEEVSVYVFAPTMKGIWLNGLRMVTAWIASIGQAMARRFGVLDWIRGRWRRQLTRARAATRRETRA